MKKDEGLTCAAHVLGVAQFIEAIKRLVSFEF